MRGGKASQPKHCQIASSLSTRAEPDSVNDGLIIGPQTAQQESLRYYGSWRNEKALRHSGFMQCFPRDLADSREFRFTLANQALSHLP